MPGPTNIFSDEAAGSVVCAGPYHVHGLLTMGREDTLMTVAFSTLVSFLPPAFTARRRGVSSYQHQNDGGNGVAAMAMACDSNGKCQRVSFSAEHTVPCLFPSITKHSAF